MHIQRKKKKRSKKRQNDIMETSSGCKYLSGEGGDMDGSVDREEIGGGSWIMKVWWGIRRVVG